MTNKVFRITYTNYIEPYSWNIRVYNSAYTYYQGVYRIYIETTLDMSMLNDYNMIQCENESTKTRD